MEKILRDFHSSDLLLVSACISCFHNLRKRSVNPQWRSIYTKIKHLLTWQTFVVSISFCSNKIKKKNSPESRVCLKIRYLRCWWHFPGRDEEGFQRENPYRLPNLKMNRICRQNLNFPLNLLLLNFRRMILKNNFLEKFNMQFIIFF